MNGNQRLHPKFFRRGKKKDRYKNCVDCGAWKEVNAAGRCSTCVDVDRHLMTLGRDLLKHNPKMTAEQVAEELGVEESRVHGWVREHKLKPQAKINRCPSCGRIIRNSFTCDSCGYGKPPDPQKKEQRKKELEHKKAVEYDPPRRVAKVLDNYWQNSVIVDKHQHPRCWMVPLGKTRGFGTG